MDKSVFSEGEWLEATAGPGETGAPGPAPALAAAAVAGLALAVLLAIAGVFLLGVAIDWRHQRMQQKLGAMKGPRQTKRAVARGGEGGEGVSIVGAELRPGESEPPAPSPAPCPALAVHLA